MSEPTWAQTHPGAMVGILVGMLWLFAIVAAAVRRKPTKKPDRVVFPPPVDGPYVRVKVPKMRVLRRSR